MELPTQEGYPGQRLGMPRSGRGSIASFGRRLIAVTIDWLACKLVAYAVFHVGFGETGARTFVPLGIFAVENILLIWTGGATLGQRLLRMRVIGQAGHRVNLVQAVTRTFLLCLFVPAVIWDKDGRSLHDKVPNTAIVNA